MKVIMLFLCVLFLFGTIVAGAVSLTYVQSFNSGDYSFMLLTGIMVASAINALGSNNNGKDS